MEKQKRWHFYLILAVIAVTLYSILPTIFYYSNPLRAPIGSEKAKEIALSSIERVDALEGESISWLASFCKLLGISPESIALHQENPKVIRVTFTSPRDAQVFARFLPTAGSLIPFVPAQINLYTPPAQNEVYVERKIGIHLDPNHYEEYFQFSPMIVNGKEISPFYRTLVYDRATEIAKAFAGPSYQALQIAAVIDHPTDQRYDDLVLSIARDLNNIVRTFGIDSSLSKRYFASFSQINRPDRKSLMEQFLVRLDTVKTQLQEQANRLRQDTSEERYSDPSVKEKQELLSSQQNSLTEAAGLIRKNIEAFKKGNLPLTQSQALAKLEEGSRALNPSELNQTIDVSQYNPFIQKMTIDWNNGYIGLKLYDDLQNIRISDGGGELQAITKEKLNGLVFNEIARISRISDEDFSPSGDEFRTALNTLADSKSFLTLHLAKLAEQYAKQIKERITQEWSPKHQDLLSSVYPIRTYEEFSKESPEEQKLGLVVYAPVLADKEIPEGIRMNSIYVIARGLGNIVEQYQESPEFAGGQVLIEDFQHLNDILQRNGYIAYPGSSYGLAPMYQRDYIFELNDYYNDFLEATRENFIVKGNKAFAVLDFSDVEQRILTTNKIEDSIQEDLQKWHEEYNSAQVSMSGLSRYTVPKPTKNVYWQNFLLSTKKYVRGDERKILKWGLDLSGGKSVRIALRDQNNRPVKDPEEIKQAINELYTRINKMGVAERTIRAENDTILLDFPGSQSFSASELVKASAMYFHIVNEKFSSKFSELNKTANAFLQDVWNEAVVTNRKDIESINEIAWKHLGGDIGGSDMLHPRSENARTLYEHGLQLVNPKTAITNQFNDTISAVAKFRGEDASEWHGQTHPLLFVFRNYALEGSSIENVHVGYDPSHGNNLLFSVKSSYESAKGGLGSPRDDFYTWTSQFAKEKITGTQKEIYTSGEGWRMAVILNGHVISSPNLQGALSDHATIQGRFTQREINRLAADLKAGSLSFTPKILSETNVSPELGKEERMRGITASVIALVLVAVAMIGYYRFAGLVATCAVLLNLLIMWAVLQAIGAALTLPGIAGIVLTIGMAVDANVLVFERIREEFAISHRIASAIQAGYRKAFSAIFDSNITTIMSALILIQFDSGPIKGFAVTLIIGIISSMFTSLFMTRYFFAGWVQNPNHKELKMMHLIGNTKIPFLKLAPKVIAVSIVVMLIGGYVFTLQRNTMLGMDFTGGYSLTVNVKEKPDVDYRKEAIGALLSAGASSGDIQVRELGRPNQLRIQLGLSMEESGHPFYGMPPELQKESFTYEYEKNPRIAWVVNALAKQGVEIQESDLQELENEWSVMSGQLSDSMRNNAMIALALALLGILIYITFRFEFKYAVAAVIALVHDIIITLGIAAIFHWLGFPVHIDLQMIGAIMTIIGYSLNDTIIVFDRIREEVHILRKLSYSEIIDHALNVTLSRTLMTSGTTLLVLMTLVLFGGEAIFGFSLVMTIGIFVGTISSLFVASPALLYFHRKESEGAEVHI